MNIDVILVNSFTENGKGGNPAGVVFNADHLSDAQKLKIAQEVGYSETAFVATDDVADYAVSFFTITGEVDFCGHATLAAFSAMFESNIIRAGSYTQRTKAGILSVTVGSTGLVLMEQQLAKKLTFFSYQEISKIIGIESNVLARTQLPIEVISTGLADLIVPVPVGYLDKIKPNDDIISVFCEKNDIIGLHVFELCGEESDFTASCRNFAPLVGIAEESATGSSCGALACYLSEYLTLGSEFIFEQGRAMNCCSRITASVHFNESQISDVKVGGFTRNIGIVTINL